jgi:hypothetical protein
MALLFMRWLAIFCAVVGWFTPACRAAMIHEVDVCVYGGTSGGVVAAVAAARLGKSVALVSLNNHVGGMTASGLGVTDIGPGNDTSYVSGISREFYRRVGAAYGSTNLVIWFEPHVAENVFWQMLAEAGVMVYSNQLLAATTVVSNRITQFTTADGTTFRAKQFIDTTYEGDLMAAAGVTFTWGREGTNAYNESLAGIRSLGGSYNYDPYVVPGNPASGLLPLVNLNTGGTVGQGDQRLQAYNYRLCLTQNATNKIAITAPTNYSEVNYELVRRYVSNRVATDGSVSLSSLIHIQTIIPNGKTDINANGELSTDYVGYNYTWATNTYAGREQIRAAHENYIRGLLYFYATSPNLPTNLNTEAQSWGLAKDEFTDNGGWPWQIYVREARRMISGYVMTQSNCEARVTAPDGICLARYHIDSHGVQRLASGNFSRWEGSIGGTPPFPYPISYRSIIPRSNECQNVFCTFALSASHVAFASCRMEPVFMMASHAAGVAAAFAIDDNVPVQQLNYAKLAAQLRAEGQLLSWSSATSSTNGIILDQGGPGTTSSSGWTAGANAGGWNGNYWHDNASGKGTKWVTYTPTLPTNGTYEVYAWWVESSNRPTNTAYDVIHASGTNRILVNQKVASGGWFKLTTTNFTAGANGKVIIRNDNTTAGTEYCIADGIRFLGLGAAAPVVTPTVEVVASDASAGVYQTNVGRFTIVRNVSDSALTVNYSLSGSAVPGVHYAALPGAITLLPGMVATNVYVTPLTTNLGVDQLSVTLNLSVSANYNRSSLSNATIVINDRPLNIWYRAHPGIGGDNHDPDGDGLPNLLEYAAGTDPEVFEPNPLLVGLGEAGLSVSWPQSKMAGDVSVALELSADLLNWQTFPSSGLRTERVDGGEVWFDRAVLTTWAGTNATGFIRMRGDN